MSEELLGIAHLLTLHVSDLVRAMCRLPDDQTADAGHVRHVIRIAEAIETMANRDGYWTPETEDLRARVAATQKAAEEILKARNGL